MTGSQPIPQQLLWSFNDEGSGNAAPMAQCPVASLRQKLRQSGLRPTRQRMLLGWLIFSKGDHHLTAESLYAHTKQAKVPLSLATVYNTLNQFSEAGLLRKVLTLGEKTIYDTCVGDHHHFLLEDSGEVKDIPAGKLDISNLPDVPNGYCIAGVDIVVRLMKIENA